MLITMIEMIECENLCHISPSVALTIGGDLHKEWKDVGLSGSKGRLQLETIHACHDFSPSLNVKNLNSAFGANGDTITGNYEPKLE